MVNASCSGGPARERRTSGFASEREDLGGSMTERLTSLEFELFRISIALADVDKRVEISISAWTNVPTGIDGNKTRRRSH